MEGVKVTAFQRLLYLISCTFIPWVGEKKNIPNVGEEELHRYGGAVQVNQIQ
jgi:hypothetical protein